MPKRFKGRAVGDLNIVGLQTSGNAGAADDLTFRLTSPSGVSVAISPSGDSPSLGPWTIDDDTPTSLCQISGSCTPDPDATLIAPYAGAANLLRVDTVNSGPLGSFNGSPMRGAWTLSVYDISSAGETSVLSSWGLRIAPARPVPDAGTGKPKAFVRNVPLSVAIDDAPASGKAVPVRTTLTAGKAFKGAVVGDLDVTGIGTTGSGANAADQLVFRLTAPNGRTVQLAEGNGDVSLGPWTFDDESPASICDSPLPCDDPSESLPPPFAGRSNTIGTGTEETGPLSSFDGVPVRGTWTLTVYDSANGATSTLNSWGLRITPAKGATTAKPGGGAKAAAKKKPGKAPKRFEGQNGGDVAIPPNPGIGTSTPATSTITVPARFKGLTVGDLDVTRLTFTGDSGSAAGQLVVRLTAPNGNTGLLMSSLGGQSVGPLTIDDESRVSACDLTSVCPSPDQTLARPFGGTANTLILASDGTGPLSSFDGAPMRGRWTLTVADVVGVANSSTLNIWGLRITPPGRRGPSGTAVAGGIRATAQNQGP